MHILPPGLVRIRHYGILGNNRRKRAIEAARAIFERRGRAVELQPQSVADKSTCCPLCGKAGIRLVAFTDAAGVLHMIGAGPTPCDSSSTLPWRSSAPQSIHAFWQNSLWMRSGVLLSSCPLRSLAPAIRGYWRGKITALGLLAPVQSASQSSCYGNIRIRIPFCRRLHPIAHGTFPIR